MVYIIGGGISSFVCAITLLRRNIKVTILEKENAPLKKLLLTGNGRCNFYNENQDISNFNTTSTNNLSLYINNNDKVLTFFDSIGLINQIKNGYYYPFSNEAISVKTALLNEAIALGLNIICNFEVIDIEKNEDLFIVKSNEKEIKTKHLIIAVGGLSYPKTGSDGSLYKVIESLNHTIIEPRPSLVSLEGENFKEIAGVRTHCLLTLYQDKKEIKEEVGELQFNNLGISGICTFNLSSYVTRNIQKENIIKINFMPFLKENVLEFLETRNKKLKNRTILELFDGVLDYKLVMFLLKKSKLSKNKSFSSLTKIEKENLKENLINYSFLVTGTKDFQGAQVTSGGVSLEEVTENFESKIHKNLYFIGEVLDVDGLCGGYNITFASLSGLKVGESL